MPEKLFEIPEFKTEIKESYKLVTPWILDIPNKIKWIYMTFEESFKNDVIDQGERYCEYQYDPFGNIQANIEFLMGWFMRRHAFLELEFLGEIING